MFLTIALFVAIEAVLAGVIIVPSIGEIRDLSKEVDARRRDLEARYQRGARLGAITTAVRTLTPSMAEWKQYFVPAQAELDIITQLETLAGRANVVQTLAFPTRGENPPSPQGTTELPLTLTVDGAYPNIVAYLRSLERLPLFVSISAWSLIDRSLGTQLSAPRGAEDHGAVLMHLDLALWHAPSL